MEFYFFIMNKSLGPNNTLLFDYSAEPTLSEEDDDDDSEPDAAPYVPLSKPGTVSSRPLPNINTLEGVSG